MSLAVVTVRRATPLWRSYHYLANSSQGQVQVVATSSVFQLRAAFSRGLINSNPTRSRPSWPHLWSFTLCTRVPDHFRPPATNGLYFHSRPCCTRARLYIFDDNAFLTQLATLMKFHIVRTRARLFLTTCDQLTLCSFQTLLHSRAALSLRRQRVPDPVGYTYEVSHHLAALARGFISSTTTRPQSSRTFIRWLMPCGGLRDTLQQLTPPKPCRS
ncbi:hypothetical protein EDB85DRAFT_1976589 [Lactarius pseudohatsudake]|nr:hypothetical protein EDB85DRAFT_1976589 [Lactarius pseudohatsudake]